MHYSFNTFIEKEYKNAIMRAAQKLLDEDNVREIPARIVDVCIQQIDVSDLLEIDDYAVLPIKICASVKCDDDCRTFRQSVMMLGEMSGTFSKLFSDFRITLSIIKPANLKNTKQKYTESLLPDYQKEKLEEIASDILEMVYPYYDIYHIPKRVDPIDMANKMGIRPYYAHLSESGTVRGQYVFEKTDLKIYYPEEQKYKLVSVGANTILIDTNLRTKWDIARFTVMHELIHAIVHKYSLWLIRMFDSNCGSLRCPARLFENQTFSEMYLDIMEKQADTLAAYVLMPAPAFKKKAKEILDRYGCIINANDYEDALRKISVFFGVSVSAAKRRLIELGFEEFRGVLNFVDDKYVPPFKFKSGSLESHQTFVVSKHQIQTLLKDDKELVKAFAKGYLRFIENHVVLNLPEFIKKNDSGAELTDYARNNMDLCALKFDRLHYPLDETITSVDTRNTMQRKFESTMTSEFILRSTDYTLEEKLSMIQIRSEDVTSITKKITQDFPQSLSDVIEWSDMTKDSIAKSSWLSDKTIYNLCNDEDIRVNIQTVIRLCVAMKLPLEVSELLITSSGNHLKETKEHNILRQFITAPDLYTMEECNQMMVFMNLKPLASKNPCQ